MSDTRIESWLEARRIIHAAATEESGGKEWFAARYTLVAGDDPDDPDEIIGDIRRGQYTTAIADAHNHLPTLVAVVEAVLKRHQRGQPYLLAVEWVCEGCSDNEDEREVPWPCDDRRALEAVIGDA